MKYRDIITSSKPDLLAILLKLKSKADPRIKIFGSMAKGSSSPNDIDLFVDLTDTKAKLTFVKFEDYDQYNETVAIQNQYSYLLTLSRQCQFKLDPFLLFANTLLVRNDASTRWVKAQNAPVMRVNMLSDGKTLDDLLNQQ